MCHRSRHSEWGLKLVKILIVNFYEPLVDNTSRSVWFKSVFPRSNFPSIFIWIKNHFYSHNCEFSRSGHRMSCDYFLCVVRIKIDFFLKMLMKLISFLMKEDHFSRKLAWLLNAGGTRWSVKETVLRKRKLWDENRHSCAIPEYRETRKCSWKLRF